MSRGKKLQEMEVKTQQSKTAVNSGAKPGESMPKMADPGTQLASVEDLGGPTPENYKPDDDSAKLKEPGGTLKQVKDVVNKGAGKADPMPTMKKEEEELSTEDTIEEEEVTTDEVVAEEEETIVRGYVFDPNGEPIENAVIQIREQRKPGRLFSVVLVGMVGQLDVLFQVPETQ